MDPRTLDLLRCLQSGPYDDVGLQHIERLLGSQRRLLRAAGDWDAIEEVVQLLEAWASAAGGGKVTAAALGAAAEIAEQELRQVAWADSLRERATAERWRGGVAAAADDIWVEQIARAEQAVEEYGTPSAVRRLADLYVQRAAPGDREQAADLYCTLGEALGYPEGRALIELALQQAPDHAEARQQLERLQLAAREDPGRMSFPEFTHPPGILEASPERGMPSPARLTAAELPMGAGLMQTPQPFSSVSPVVLGDMPRRVSAVDDRASHVVRWLAFGTLGLSAAAALLLFVRAPQAPGAAAAAAHRDLPHANAARSYVPQAITPTLPTPVPVPLVNAPDPLARNTPPPPAAQPSAPKPVHVPTPTVRAVLKQLTVRGGTYTPTSFSSALDTVYPRLEQCYASTLQHHRVKGRLILGFTVKPNGRVIKAKSLGGTIKDPALIRCSVDALGSTRFPKPRKQAAKVKLPLQYQPS